MTIIQFPNKFKVDQEELTERDEVNQNAGELRKNQNIDILSNAAYLYLINKLFDAGFDEDIRNEVYSHLLDHVMRSIHATISAFYGQDSDYSRYIYMIEDIKDWKECLTEMDNEVIKSLNEQGSDISG